MQIWRSKIRNYVFCIGCHLKTNTSKEMHNHDTSIQYIHQQTWATAFAWQIEHFVSGPLSRHQTQTWRSLNTWLQAYSHDYKPNVRALICDWLGKKKPVVQSQMHFDTQLLLKETFHKLMKFWDWSWHCYFNLVFSLFCAFVSLICPVTRAGYYFKKLRELIPVP